jgi:hypothetical protein
MTSNQMVRSFFLTLIFGTIPAMAQNSCRDLFSRASLQETLIVEMGELELVIQERLRSEADPEEQNLLSNQLVELESLINDTLETDALNQFRLSKYSLILEEIKNILDPSSKKIKPVPLTGNFEGLKLLVIQTPEIQLAARNLPAYLGKKYFSFLAEVESIASIDRLLPIWHLERFNVWAQLSRAGFIVHLGGEHFVFFTVEPAQTIVIRGFYDKRPVPPPIDEALRGSH